MNPAMGFPMEMDRFPGGSLGRFAQAGRRCRRPRHMGIHRNVIHPKFGNFILLGTVLSLPRPPRTTNPRLQSVPRVQALRGGLSGRAISPDGHFNFSACYTHNYREFMGGFSDWVEQVADAKSASTSARRVDRPETVSMWQSLAFGANYKAAYCLSVCPAGEDVIGPFSPTGRNTCSKSSGRCRRRRRRFTSCPAPTPKPTSGSRFPHKTVEARRGMFAAAHHRRFLPECDSRSSGLSPTGWTPSSTSRSPGRNLDATVDIRDSTPSRRRPPGHAELRLTADSETWLGFLAKSAACLGVASATSASRDRRSC